MSIWADIHRRSNGIQDRKENLKKLTYGQIAVLISNGMFDEIPNAYKIKYLGGKPGKVYDFNVSGDYVSISGNHFPKPTNAYVIGENVIDTDNVFMRSKFDCIEPLEFDEDVVIKTKFEWTKCEFEYADPSEISKWLNMFENEVYYGTAIKSNYTFDSTITSNGVNLKLYNLIPEKYSNLSTPVKVNFTFDWMKIEY